MKRSINKYLIYSVIIFVIAYVILSAIFNFATGQKIYNLGNFNSFLKTVSIVKIAELKKNSTFCEKLSSFHSRRMCILKVAPIQGDYKSCYKIEKASTNQIQYNLNSEENLNFQFNEETKDIDSCIFKVVDENNIVEEGICEEIKSPYYHYLCRQRFAMNTDNALLCNLDYLGSQGNVDGCILNVAKDLNDISLCNQHSEPVRCNKYIKTGVIETRPSF